MTASGDDSSRLRRAVMILAVALALVVGIGAGLGIAAIATGNAVSQPVMSNSPTPQDSYAPPSPSVSASPQKTQAAAAPAAQAAAANPAPAACPAGGLSVKLNGGAARANGQVVTVVAGWLFTNTSPTHAINISDSGAIDLNIHNAAGASLGTLRDFLPAAVVNLGAMKVLTTEHQGFNLVQWNQSTTLRSPAGYPQLKATWVGSGCRVPITDAGHQIPLPALR